IHEPAGPSRRAEGARRAASTRGRFWSALALGGPRAPGAGEASAKGDAAGLVQRKCAACADEEEKTVARKESSPEAAGGSAPASVGEALQGGGRPLDAGTRSYFEMRFGRDLGDVRIHDDSRADRSARDVSALAYTVGHDLVFRAGQYAPSTAGGR